MIANPPKLAGFGAPFLVQLARLVDLRGRLVSCGWISSPKPIARGTPEQLFHRRAIRPYRLQQSC